jgi:all-trans-retinol 13,14-reductase
MKESKNKTGIPGMLYVFISFIPWIFYWSLCGFGSKAGIAVPLIASIVLIIPQIRRKSINLMDAASVLYFSLAAVGVFGFNLSVFIEESGLMGYMVLFLMSFLSLAIKKPFTFQSAKRDYPKSYWQDKTFVLMNMLITGVWACIFLLNSLLFLLPDEFSPQIFSNILLAGGIVFSVYFPKKAPAFFVSKNFRKHDWRVDADLEKEKTEDKFDVIVVGAGVAGLACASLLSKNNYRVLVLEQHSIVGGYCTSFERKKFRFNAGVEDVSGVDRGALKHFMEELGLKKEDLFRKNTNRYIFGGRAIEGNSLEGLKRELYGMFPREKEGIASFFQDAKHAYEENCQYTSLAGVPLPAELMTKVFGEKGVLDFPKNYPHFYDWMSKTYQNKLDEYFESEELKRFLCSKLSYFGLSKPEQTPGLLALMSLSFDLEGGYFMDAQNFVETLKSLIESQGSEVLVRQMVDKIVVENGEVRGVEVGGKVFRSKIIVSNANARSTFMKLVGEEHLDKNFVSYLNSLKMSPSCFMLFLGLDMDLEGYPTLIKNLDEGYEISINSNAFPGMAPPGKASMTAITSATYAEFPERDKKEYSKLKKEHADNLTQKIERIIPGLTEKITVREAATPRTLERYTLMPEGALYSFDQSLQTQRPSFKTPIRGMYLTGASTFPGGGIESAVISGTICARDICNWEVKAQ